MDAETTFKPNFKDPRGTALLASRGRRAERRAAEQKELQAALDRDGGGKGKRLCRFPTCEFKSQKLPIDPCHMRQPDGTKHRGMGGDPSGDRTQRAWVCSFWRAHHGLYDAGAIDAQPITDKGFDGPASFSRRHEETGVMLHVATEELIGVPETRGA